MKKFLSFAACLLLSTAACEAYRSCDTDLKNHAQRYNAWAIHTMVDLHGCSYSKVRSVYDLERCINELCYKMNVRRVGSPITVHHEAGYGYTSGYTITQHANNHTDITLRVDEYANNVYVDICSCASYDAYRLYDYLIDCFNAYDSTIDILFRK